MDGVRKPVDEVGIAELKARATKLLPRVARTGRVLRVLKRGKVLVEVHPPSTSRPEPFVGRARGTATAPSDLTSPLDEPWETSGHWAPHPRYRRQFLGRD
jgi:antitoxin (DNA-binding transcriptional repressor) of toxin-antitoxin stability system